MHVLFQCLAVVPVSHISDKVVFRQRYPRKDVLRLVNLVVQAEFLDAGLYRAYRITGIIDSEV